MFDLDFTVTPSKSASLPVIAFDTVDSLKAGLLCGQPSSSLSQAWVTVGCKNHPSMRRLPRWSCQHFDHKNDRCRHCSVSEDEDDMFYMILLRSDFLPFDKL